MDEAGNLAKNSISPETVRNKIIEVLESKKALQINSIDIRKISVLADYFIVCTGTSTTHIKTLADEVEEKTAEIGAACAHREGYDSAKWILLDFGDVVVHLFLESEREFYSLERLWADGKIELIKARQQ